MHRAIIRNIVAVVAKRRREEGHQPNGVDAELLQVVEPLRQPTEVSVAVAAAVIKSADVNLINNCVFVPKRVFLQRSFPRIKYVRHGHFCPRKDGDTCPLVAYGKSELGADRIELRPQITLSHHPEE